MNRRHTPGPWKAKHGRYVNTSVRDSEGHSICAMPSTQKRPSDEQIANARLIAAAPEMLSVLRKMLASWAIVTAMESEDHSRIREIIAKATGEKA